MLNSMKNKKILVIGGTGTIGKTLVKTLLQFGVQVVRIFSRDEYKQFELSHELANHKNVRFLIGDVRDFNRLVRAMEGIDFVFHLAAMKHVPACEYNPFEAVQTNIIGTQNVIQAAIQAGVKKVIFTSTDKAISPTNTYGATKLAAERLIAAAENQKGPHGTIFSAVRFGNVMGSRGSVIPLFKKQILNGESVTLTLGSCTRFMMTVSQAVNLLLKVADISRGGEIFVLKMPVLKIADLTDVLVEQITKKYGILRPVNISEIGMRPGEKVFEELMTIEESRSAVELPDMFVIPSHYRRDKVHYQDGKPAMESSYSSQDQTPLTSEQIRELLTQEELF